MDTSTFVRQLENVRPTSSGWMARCPAHEDMEASLAVATNEDGRTLFHCHGGCSPTSVLAAMNLTFRDLSPSTNGQVGRNGRAKSNKKGQPKKIISSYIYRDETGQVLFRVVRMEPKDFRQQRLVGNMWVYGTAGAKQAPYRLPGLIKADPEKTVFVTEGEKDVDRLINLGLISTCNPGGAEKWKHDYAQYFRGRRVVILPDNDAPGRKHAVAVAKSLRSVAVSVKVLELPGLPPKGDMSDWLDAGGTPEEFKRLIDNTPEWEPSAGSSSALGVPVDGFSLTDSGLAERFAMQHGDAVRYCRPWGKWLAWDGTRWKLDDLGRVDQLAKQTVRSIFREAADEADPDRREELARFALRCESIGKRKAMIELGKSEPPIPILPADLDANLWALNCLNGTVDLRTGKLREHRPDDRITKLAPVEYHVDASAPLWESVLQKVFDGNQTLIGYVHRLFGYATCGEVTEHVLPICHGVGSNGKSTILNAVKETLGEDYAIEAPPDLLMLRHGQHPTELARLHGRRIVVALETEEGRRLAESLMKQLTGGDTISCRRMREDFWEFQPTHTIFVGCNHKPVIKGTDWGTWRRIALIPFHIIIPESEQDKRLPLKLQEEAPGILAWLVRGCLAWQAIGLQPPAEVQLATAAYRDAEDVFGAFLTESCILEPDVTVPAKDLYRAYKKYCESNGEKILPQRAFGIRMTDRKFDRYTNNGIWYRGLDLRNEAEPWSLNPI